MPSTDQLEKKAFYLPELDLLRAGAFLAVFFSHWIPQERVFYAEHGFDPLVARMIIALAASGGTGVMLFFCLSSYLITQLLIKEIAARGHVDVRAFYMRRILRIWPLYLFFTLIAAVLPYFDPTEHFGWKAVTAFLFFGGNWIWALNIPVNTIALPLWSISVEEQFYLCWPWVVRRATRRSLRNIVFGLFLLAAINRTLIVFRVLNVDLWHNTFTQLDSIGLGALLALGIGPRLEAVRDRMRGLLIAGALVMIYVLDFVRGDVIEMSRTNLYYYPGVAFSCAVILYATIGVKLDLKSRLVRVVVYLGKISYGLYVWHYGCFYVAGVLYHLLPKSPHFVIGFVARGLFAMGLALALASLSYRFLEQPFLRFKKKFARTPATAATLPAP